MTPGEVAEMLGISARTVRHWCSTGYLPASRVGARWKIARSTAYLLIQAHHRRAEFNPRSRLIDHNGNDDDLSWFV